MRHSTRNPVLLARARAMRHAASAAERRLWSRVRGHRLAGWHFRRQHVCGRFILDLYCTQAKLAVEIDGDTHAHTAQKARDDERARCLAARGIRVLRFWNDEVLTQTDTVLELLSRTLADRTPLPIPLPASGERGVQQLPRPGTGEE